MPGKVKGFRRGMAGEMTPLVKTTRAYGKESAGMPSKASDRALAARKQGRIGKHQGAPFQSLLSPPSPSPLLRCTIRLDAALSFPSLSTPSR